MTYRWKRKEILMSPQSLIDAAKAPVHAYGKKDWDAVQASLGPGALYEEIATHRKMQGADKIIPVWQGWATAFPDSKATFHRALVSGNTVILEVTWRGTHKGPLQLPGGPVQATGKTIELPACMITEIRDGKATSMRQYFDMATLLQQVGIALAA
jgi:steroid delta-isomerase-like uncharacterized protein